MNMISHTAEEIISFDNVQDRWKIDYKEFTRIVFSNHLTCFGCKKIIRNNNIVCYVGNEFYFDPNDDISLYYEMFSMGFSINRDDKETYYFLLTKEVHKYETENPYLFGEKLDGQEWLDAFQQTTQADAPLSASLPQAPTPLPSPNGGQSEELAQARVAKLEEENQDLRDEIERLKLQLAEKATAQGQGVDATQMEELQKELKALKEALKTATKAPAPQAMGTYWLLLHVLFLEQGIDCRTIDFSTSKTRYATDLEKKIHGIGCTLDDKTIRAKMKEVQAYMDKEKNG